MKAQGDTLHCWCHYSLSLICQHNHRVHSTSPPEPSHHHSTQLSREKRETEAEKDINEIHAEWPQPDLRLVDVHKLGNTEEADNNKKVEITEVLRELETTSKLVPAVSSTQDKVFRLLWTLWSVRLSRTRVFETSFWVSWLTSCWHTRMAWKYWACLCIPVVFWDSFCRVTNNIEGDFYANTAPSCSRGQHFLLCCSLYTDTWSVSKNQQRLKHFGIFTCKQKHQTMPVML